MFGIWMCEGKEERNEKYWTSQETPGVTGKFGLGIRNEAGQRLIEFCQENALVITNTLSQQHKRRLYTWTSPDGQHQNQISLKLTSIESVMPSSHLILCRPLLLLPSIFPNFSMGLFKWVSSSHQVAKILEFQLHHQSFQ